MAKAKTPVAESTSEDPFGDLNQLTALVDASPVATEQVVTTISTIPQQTVFQQNPVPLYDQAFDKDGKPRFQPPPPMQAPVNPNAHLPLYDQAMLGGLIPKPVEAPSKREASISGSSTTLDTDVFWPEQLPRSVKKKSECVCIFDDPRGIYRVFEQYLKRTADGAIRGQASVDMAMNGCSVFMGKAFNAQIVETVNGKVVLDPAVASYLNYFAGTKELPKYVVNPGSDWVQDGETWIIFGPYRTVVAYLGSHDGSFDPSTRTEISIGSATASRANDFLICHPKLLVGEKVTANPVQARMA